VTKDGFYLAESDDEADAPEQKLSKKQRKRQRRREQGNGHDSDSSTEDTLQNVSRTGLTAQGGTPGSSLQHGGGAKVTIK